MWLRFYGSDQLERPRVDAERTLDKGWGIDAHVDHGDFRPILRIGRLSGPWNDIESVIGNAFFMSRPTVEE